MGNQEDSTRNPASHTLIEASCSPQLKKNSWLKHLVRDVLLTTAKRGRGSLLLNQQLRGNQNYIVEGYFSLREMQLDIHIKTQLLASLSSPSGSCDLPSRETLM